MSKIAIVGVEGSGKTVLMAGLSECYKQTSETEPYLMPENQSAFMFMQCIPHKLRVNREWPEQTRIDSLRMMKWSLRCGQKIFKEIEILDYPGELYRIAFGEHTKAEADAVRSELDEFLVHLTDADTLVVLLNLADLRDLPKNPRNLETVWITRGIFDFSQKLPNIKHRMLAFTQADRYVEEINMTGSLAALYAEKLPMLKALYPDLKVFTITALDGISNDGRPAEDYSVTGCYGFMKEVLVDENKIYLNSLTRCDQLFDSLVKFNYGGPKAFNTLILDYLVACEELKENTKPLWQIYKNIINEHLGRSSHYSSFFEVTNTCPKQKKHSVEEFAQEITWSEILKDFNGCDKIIVAFSSYFRDILIQNKMIHRKKWR